MQQLGIVKSISPVVEQEYQKADGTSASVKKCVLVVSLFGETVGLDVVGDRLTGEVKKLRAGHMVHVRFSFNAREWTDKNQQQRITTDIILREVESYGSPCF